VTLPSPAELPKDAGVTLPASGGSVGRVAEEQKEQGNVELKDSLPESGMAWSSAAFIVAVIPLAALLGSVIYLFIRWRNTGQGTVAVYAATDHVPEKDLEGGEEKAPLETTPGEVPPDTVSIETSEVSTTDSGAVESVAQLAKLYAMGTPSEKEFQLLKELIPQSLGDPQEPKLT
jgi:hypothetical protein